MPVEDSVPLLLFVCKAMLSVQLIVLATEGSPTPRDPDGEDYDVLDGRIDEFGSSVRGISDEAEGFSEVSGRGGLFSDPGR